MIDIRPARHTDSPFIAEMIQLSMGSLAGYLFNADDRSIKKYVENLVIRNAGRFGFRLSFIAESNGVSKGVLLSYKGKRIDLLNISTLPHLFPAMGLSAFGFMKRGVNLPGGREAYNDEYYISNLGVHPSAQGQGIGSDLLKFAEGLARRENLTKCALIVGSYNPNACRLYQRLGYQIVETVQDDSPALGYHRMVKVI
jgi:ribosomal protein S18 acetylase RimI-like enzyme